MQNLSLNDYDSPAPVILKAAGRTKEKETSTIKSGSLPLFSVSETSKQSSSDV